MAETTNPLPYENIERLVTTEMRPHNMLQGYVRPLYEAARGSGEPITLRIANEIHDVSTGRVAILTGIALEEYFPRGEVDGPIGSVALARALTRLGFTVDLLVEDAVAPVTNRLVGMLEIDVGNRSTSDLSSEGIRSWADDYDVAITVEKIGRASNGRRHSVMATPIPPGDSYVDDLIVALTDQGKLTIGIGDGGNEIGFGKLHGLVEEMVPRGGELGTVTATRHLFPAAVSNFGAYALCAALALRFEDTDLLMTGDAVIDLIRAAIEEGCLDGGTVDPDFIGDDGIPEAGVSAVVDVLHTIVTQWFGSFDRHF